MAEFEVMTINDLFNLLVDLDRGRSVTNDGPKVINELHSRVPGGIGRRTVYYRDTMGRFDRILVNDDGKFAGFAPCSTGQQERLKAIVNDSGK